MDTRRQTPARRLGPPTGRATVALLALLALAVLLGACGGSSDQARSPSPPALLVGERGGSPAMLVDAARLAQRFARVYARAAYRRRAPVIREESGGVRRALAAAATRVPAPRRGLQPRLLGLRLWLRGHGALAATARIGDGRFPSFSVGFTVSRRGGGWLITSVALPD